MVYLSERRGTDNFTLPVALEDLLARALRRRPRRTTRRWAAWPQIAARVAQIQQDNLLDVHNFVDRSRIRMMEMEWVDGYDLGRLLTREMLERTCERASAPSAGNYINKVIVTAGPMQPRLKPGIAIADRPRVPGRRWRPCTARASSTAT